MVEMMRRKIQDDTPIKIRIGTTWNGQGFVGVFDLLGEMYVTNEIFGTPEDALKCAEDYLSRAKATRPRALRQSSTK